MKRLQCESKELDIFLTYKVLEKKRYSSEWINVQKPHLIKNGIPIPCNTENFVLIVVPSLSASSSSSSDQSAPKTPSRQESDYPTFPSSSSSTPTVTYQVKMRPENEKIELKVTLLQCQYQQILTTDRGNLLSTKPIKIHKTQRKGTQDRTRCNPLFSEIPELLQKFNENFVVDEVHERGNFSRQFFSCTVSLEPTFKRREDLGKHSVCTHFPKDRNCGICQRT